MENVTKVSDGISDYTDIISDITSGFGSAVNNTMKWLSKITLFEWIIILFIIITVIILLYLKSKVKENIKPKFRY